MVDDGTTVYDYHAIDECVNAMLNVAKGIEAETENLETSAKKALGNWTGATADAYSRAATDLGNKLTQQVQNLTDLNKALAAAAHDMNAQDQKGGQTISSR